MYILHDVASGRKLPTDYTSQQLLRWLRPKKIYFFSFFRDEKIQKNSTYNNSSSLRDWHMSDLETMSKKYSGLRFLTPQNVKFWDVRNRTFWQICRFLQKSQKSGKIEKIAKIPKNRKNRKNRKNPKNLDFLRFLAFWVGPYRTSQKVDFWHFGGPGSDLPGGCPDSDSGTFGRSGQVPKKSKFWHFLDPQKSRKIGLYAVGTTRRKWRHRARSEGKKIVNFWTFGGVKEKNVQNPGWNRDFLISNFFSKFDCFEGQRQRRPRKGSPSCPVIFHRGGNWKWSIYSTLGAGFGGPDSLLAGFGRSGQTWPNRRSSRPATWQVRTADPARPGQTASLARSSRIWLPGWNPARILVRARNRQNRQNLDFSRKVPDLSIFADFRILQILTRFLSRVLYVGTFV